MEKSLFHKQTWEQLDKQMKLNLHLYTKSN